jgi:chemotaxis protein methyltransferase CheR
MPAFDTGAPLARLAQRLEAETALYFGGARQRALGPALARMAQACGMGEQVLADWLAGGEWDQAKADLCARHLTVAETYFFREARGFELLCDYARNKLGADPAARLRLWSAGCCTGEEPYSMAIALNHALPSLDPRRVDILGTDINPASLAHARAAVYREWSFRQTSAAQRALHFTAAGPGRYLLRAALRERVRFAQLNLALPLYPSPGNGTAGIDIIFCRNVLMYFSRPQMARVVARLRACLVDGGWLVVSPSEASAELFAGFEAVYHPDAIFYRKSGAPADAPRQPSCAAGTAAAGPMVRAASRTPDAPRPAHARRAAPADAAALSPSRATLQAQDLARAGDVAGALQGLARAADEWPLVGSLPLAAAQIALDAGEHEAARRLLKRHLYLEPGSAFGHYLSAVAHICAGHAAGAMRLFAASEELLARLPLDAPVPGADGWQAGALRACVQGWLERRA